jgi:nitric oxide reductase NorQ protein
MLVVSYNPGYQNLLKGMKPSTRQRFIALSFDFPEAELETEVLIGESGIDRATATKLVQLGASLRALQDHDLEEGASTRLLVYAATLINSGMAVRDACKAALVEPLTDDDETLKALLEVVDATLG